MSGLLITVEVRSVYGRDTIYPVDDAARTFAEIAGTKTLTMDVIRAVTFLGYEVRVVQRPSVLDVCRAVHLNEVSA